MLEISSQWRNSLKEKGMKICREEHCTQVFRKVDKECIVEERDRGHVISVQEQALRTNAIKAKIDKQPVSAPKCILCGTKVETVMHLP